MPASPLLAVSSTINTHKDILELATMEELSMLISWNFSVNKEPSKHLDFPKVSGECGELMSKLYQDHQLTWQSILVCWILMTESCPLICLMEDI